MSAVAAGLVGSPTTGPFTEARLLNADWQLREWPPQPSGDVIVELRPPARYYVDRDSGGRVLGRVPRPGVAARQYWGCYGTDAPPETLHDRRRAMFDALERFAGGAEALYQALTAPGMPSLQGALEELAEGWQHAEELDNRREAPAAGVAR